MKYQAVAFDMDGLMFDTETVYWHAATQLLARRGYTYTDEINRAIMGRPAEICFRTMIEQCHLSESWQELQQESENIFLNLLPSYYQAMPGLFTLLDALENGSVPKAICTSSSRRLLQAVLGQEQLESRFAFTLTSGDITHGKPDPEIYLQAAARFQVSPGAMLVLEDSVAGSEAAAAAGSDCFVVLAPHNRQLHFPKATKILNSLADVTNEW